MRVGESDVTNDEPNKTLPLPANSYCDGEHFFKRLVRAGPLSSMAVDLAERHLKLYGLAGASSKIATAKRSVCVDLSFALSLQLPTAPAANIAG